jgi:CBS domain-containing protein
VKIRDVMTTEVVTVGPDTPFKEVVECLVGSGVSGLPVIDAQRRLVGIVTEADLISKEAYGGRPRALAVVADMLSAREHPWVTKATGWVAADVMTSNVETCEPAEDVRVATRRMLERRVKRMPVVEEGRLVGIVSRQDILRMFARSDEEIRGDVSRVLTSHPNRPDDCHVHFGVEQGSVTLTGDVRYEWDEQIVVSMVREVEGVIDVISHLHHREPNPRTSTSPWTFGG